MESLGEKIKRLSDEIDADTLEFASDEELLEYLFLVNKLKLKLIWNWIENGWNI